MAQIESQQYEVVDIDSLQLFPGNPKKGDIKTIRSLIDTNGFYGACIVQRSTNRIIVGNHRWLSAKEEGLKEIPVIFVDVDDDRAKRINLADNRSAELGSYDEQLLADILSSLDTPSIGTGFTDDAVQDILAAMEPIDLDAMANSKGEPKDEDLWPQLSFRIPALTFSAWREYVSHYDGNEATALAALLNVTPNE